MSVYVRCETRQEALVPKSLENVSLRQRQVSKNGSNMYLGDNGLKELVIICDHVHFSHKNGWTQDCFLSPKGAGPWQNLM